jgi:hypothetical protein
VDKQAGRLLRHRFTQLAALRLWLVFFLWRRLRAWQGRKHPLPDTPRFTLRPSRRRR